LGIGAFITQPYLREGRWLAALTAFSTHPRTWDSKDEQLLKAVLARTWPRIERARAVKELKESESFASKILSSGLNGLYIYDMKAGKNVYINEQYTEITGYTLEFFSSLEDRDFIHLFHPEDQPMLESHMLEVMLMPQKGSPSNLLTVSEPLMNAGSGAARGTLFSREIWTVRLARSSAHF
jgi:PAS domain-containing protein